MIQIDRMMGIILVLVFVVVLAAFGYQMVNRAEQSASGKIQINNTQAMTQLVMYNSLIAYTCSDEKGGFHEGTQTVGGDIYWGSWQNYYDNHDFEALERASGGDLECYGSTSKLPLSQGIGDEINPIGKDTWLNDQAGEYSRKDFVITEDGVQLGPCILHESNTNDNDMNAVYFMAGPDVSAVSTYNGGDLGRQGPGYPFPSGDEITSGDCTTIDGSPESSIGQGPAITTIVMEGQDAETSEISGWGTISSDWGTGGDSNFDVREYELCKGTAGYIQTNVGPNDEEKNRNPLYTPDNPPGDSDVETGNDPTANTVHPFIVFTNWNDECY